MAASISRFQLVTLLLFTLFFLIYLRDPPYELHSFIHVFPTWMAIGMLLVSTKYFPLSNGSFGLLIAFLVLHVVGTRFIYSFVPYDDWSTRLLGVTVTETLNLSRNHYDRLVHFCYGLLIAPVAQEVQLKLLQVRREWSYWTAVEFVLASSMLFELGEWLGAINLAPDFADSYLGQQGDAWDAHQDMGLAAVGAVLSMLAVAISRARHRRSTRITHERSAARP